MAAPSRGASPERRTTVGAVLVLLLYLWTAPPVFALGPLAGLLAASGARSARERWWLLGTGAWAVAWLLQVGSLFDQVIRAAGVMLTGAFVSASLLGGGTFLARAGAALAAAAAGTTLAAASLGIGWRQVERDVARSLHRLYRAVGETEAAGGGAASDRAGAMLEAFHAMVEPTARLFPALLAVWALLGLALAWAWYQRIARAPVGPPLGRFADLRFSDHFAWAFVLPVGALLAGPGEPAATLAANLLLLACALYGARGAAIVAAVYRRVPLPVLLAGALGTMFLLPLVSSGLVLLGLADTWVDFRRHLPASHGD